MLESLRPRLTHGYNGRMKLNCIYCGKLFSISAEQLGGQGKCPHCHEIVYLPKADSPVAAADTSLLHASASWHYVIAFGAAVLLHMVLLMVLAVTSWDGDKTSFAASSMRVKIGRPAPRSSQSNPETRLNPQPAAAPSEVPIEQLKNALNQIDLSSLSQSPSASESHLESLDHNDLSALISGSEALQADLNEDFGALLNRLQRDGLDVVITFDSTGSMTGEIEQVKNRIRRIGRTLMEMIPQTRISICTYRDQGDRYVVKGLPLTRNLDQIQLFLNDISAGGGEDDPEAVDKGIQWSIYENHFNPTARKVILIFGDAPPHENKQADCLRMVDEFHRTQGGVVSTVTCRSRQCLNAFEQIAKFGGGEAFLTRDEREIVSQLMILVFGSQHRDKVQEAFDLLQR